MFKTTSQKEKGFSLIEMIVSLGLFSVVITIAVGALLVMVNADRQLQAEQSVMSNLAFALDSMTRELRTGSNYYCYTANSSGGIFDGSDSQEGLSNSTNDCTIGRQSSAFQGVSFYEGGNSISKTANRILYFYNPDTKSLFRRVGDNSAESLISSNLEIIDAQFFVSGSDILSVRDDTVQPSITIYLEAREKDVVDKTYQIQTTVNQRILDI